MNDNLILDSSFEKLVKKYSVRLAVAKKGVIYKKVTVCGNLLEDEIPPNNFV